MDILYLVFFLLTHLCLALQKCTDRGRKIEYLAEFMYGKSRNCMNWNHVIGTIV